MKHHHPLTPYKRRLRPGERVLLMVGTFSVTVLGGLYGPQLATRLLADDPALGVVRHMAASPRYSNCSDAHAAGVYSIPRGSPAYREEWDGDGDGLACEPHRRR